MLTWCSAPVTLDDCAVQFKAVHALLAVRAAALRDMAVMRQFQCGMSSVDFLCCFADRCRDWTREF